MVKTLSDLRDIDKNILAEKGQNAKKAINSKFSQKELLDRFCCLIDRAETEQ